MAANSVAIENAEKALISPPIPATRAGEILSPPEHPVEVFLHRRPLRGEDGEAGRVPRGIVRGQLAGPDDALETAAEALDGGPGTSIPGVRLQADAAHPQDLETVAQHQELGLGVGAGTDRT